MWTRSARRPRPAPPLHPRPAFTSRAGDKDIFFSGETGPGLKKKIFIWCLSPPRHKNSRRNAPCPITQLRGPAGEAPCLNMKTAKDSKYLRSASSTKVKDQSKQTYGRKSGDRDAGNQETAISCATPSTGVIKKERDARLTSYDMIKKIKLSVEKLKSKD